MRRKLMILLVIIIALSLLWGCSSRQINDSQGDNSPSPTGQQPTPQPQPIPAQPAPVPPTTDAIREQIKGMTLDEKLGQMIIAGVEGYSMDQSAKSLLEEYRVGGIILFGSNIQNPQQLLDLINTLKNENSANPIPLFISVDEEGGRISRIPKVIKNLPTSKEIGESNNSRLSYDIGLLLAEKVKAFGFNMDFAPVLDINSNPRNPVIGDRAFASTPDIVSKLGIETMKGIREGAVIPVVKHFPGHGDTSVDSHIGLPSVANDLNRLKSFELIPFQNAIRRDVDCIMAAHILLPKIDAKNPATLSKTIITDILRQQLGYNGVVITDDMTMGAISKNYELGIAALKAVDAGADIVLIAHGTENAITAIKVLRGAVEARKISEDRIDESVYRILVLKQKYAIKDSGIEKVDVEKINRRIEDTLGKYMNTSH